MGWVSRGVRLLANPYLLSGDACKAPRSAGQPSSASQAYQRQHQRDAPRLTPRQKPLVEGLKLRVAAHRAHGGHVEGPAQRRVAEAAPAEPGLAAALPKLGREAAVALVVLGAGEAALGQPAAEPAEELEQHGFERRGYVARDKVAREQEPGYALGVERVRLLAEAPRRERVYEQGCEPAAAGFVIELLQGVEEVGPEVADAFHG